MCLNGLERNRQVEEVFFSTYAHFSFSSSATPHHNVSPALTSSTTSRDRDRGRGRRGGCLERDFLMSTTK